MCTTNSVGISCGKDVRSIQFLTNTAEIIEQFIASSDYIEYTKHTDYRILDGCVLVTANNSTRQVLALPTKLSATETEVIVVVYDLGKNNWHSSVVNRNGSFSDMCALNYTALVKMVNTTQILKVVYNGSAFSPSTLITSFTFSDPNTISPPFRAWWDCMSGHIMSASFWIGIALEGGDPLVPLALSTIDCMGTLGVE